MRGQTDIPPAIAVLALVIAAAAVAITALRCVALYSELEKVRSLEAQSKDKAADSLVGALSLPSNRRLRFCNETGSTVQVTTLAAAYWVGDGTLRQFNSAEHGWQNWTIEPKHDEAIQMNPAWDGSTVFYAAEVQRAGHPVSLLAGTSADWKNGGCIAMRAE
jgi:hypothetical protein